MTQPSKPIKPTNDTVAGRAYLVLRREAGRAGRTMAEYLRLYALEGFLLRLSHSARRDQLVLKGGVLLAAHDLGRPTAGIDVAALRTTNSVDEIRKLLTDVAATLLPAGLDDGLLFDLDTVTAEPIRDEDEYSGVRVRMLARLATARQPFHVDVKVGDPIWPAPTTVELPRLIDEQPIGLRAYPVELVVAEKVITALQRGWRAPAGVTSATPTYSSAASSSVQARSAKRCGSLPVTAA